MFTFYESDWFTIVLEVLFLLFIVYDTRRYLKTRKREYLLNIVLAVVFFFWALVPFYNKYYSWKEGDKERVLATCVREYNQSYCTCLEDKIFKEYDFESFKVLDKQDDEDYQAFLDEVDKECRGEEGWF